MKHSYKFYVVLIFLVIIVNFFIPRLMPGSPIAHVSGGSDSGITATERERINSAYGLDKPMVVQFKDYVVGFFTLNWGTSYIKNEKITTIIGRAMPWTLLLSVSNLLLSTAIGCYIGFRSAMRRRDKKDLKYMIGVSAISSMPLFWVGMTFVAIFSVTLGWFPLNNAYSLWAGNTGFAWVMDVAWHLVLPLLTLATSTIMTFFVAMRFGVLTVVCEDYLMMARLRGLSNKRVKFSYIFRNAVIPVFTVFMTEVGYILGGSLVIETIFAYPGLGKLMYDAVITRDYPLVQYTFVIVSLLVILTNFVADILYSKIDVRMERSDEQ